MNLEERVSYKSLLWSFSYAALLSYIIPKSGGLPPEVVYESVPTLGIYMGAFMQLMPHENLRTRLNTMGGAVTGNVIGSWAYLLQ